MCCRGGMEKREYYAEVNGFPSTYNVVKAKSFVERNCGIKVVKLLLQGTRALITLKSDDDLRALNEKLPGYIEFGNTKYTLSLARQPDHEEPRAPPDSTSSRASNIPDSRGAWSLPHRQATDHAQARASNFPDSRGAWGPPHRQATDHAQTRASNFPDSRGAWSPSHGQANDHAQARASNFPYSPGAWSPSRGQATDQAQTAFGQSPARQHVHRQADFYPPVQVEQLVQASHEPQHVQSGSVRHDFSPPSMRQRSFVPATELDAMEVDDMAHGASPAFRRQPAMTPGGRDKHGRPTSPSATAAGPVLDTRKVYDWFSMPTMSRNPGKRGILVQDIHKDISPKQVAEYFQSGLQDDGVKQMVFLLDGVFILFHHEQSATSIESYKPHHINGHEVTVLCKEIPEFYMNKILLKNLPAGETILQPELENYAENQAIPKHIKVMSPSVTMVEFDDDLEQDVFGKLRENFLSDPANKSAEITLLAKTDCILMTESSHGSEIVRERWIRAYLQNKNITGITAKVTRVDQISDGNHFLAYFTSWRDAEAIHGKFDGTTLQIRDSNFKIDLYFHCFMDLHLQLKETNTTDSYYITWQDRDSGPIPFDFTDVHEEVIKFFQKNGKHLQEMQKVLQNLAKAELMTVDDLSTFKITPFLNSKSLQNLPKNQLEFKSECSTKIKNFLDKYKSTRRTFNSDVLLELRQYKLDPKLDPDYTGDEDVSLQWIDPRHNTAIITGVKEKVDASLEDLMQVTDVNTVTLSFPLGKYRWLTECGIVAEAQSKQHVGIQSNNDAQTLTFTGNPAKITEAKLVIFQNASQVNGEKFEASDSKQKEYLADQTHHDLIIKYVEKVFKQAGIQAILTIENMVPSIWCHFDKTHEAIQLLGNSFKTEYFDKSSQPHKNLLQTQAWKDFVKDCEKSRLVMIIIESSKLAITGMKTSVEGVSEKVKEFLEENVLREEMFDTDYGKAKAIVEFQTEFKSVCQIHDIKHNMKYGSPGGIVVRGKGKDLARVMQQLNNWNKRLKYDLFTVEKHDISRYFEHGQGKELIAKTSRAHKCVILLRSTAWPIQLSEDVGQSTDQFGPLTVSVREGDITNDRNDAIVNTVGANFDLAKGLVSRAILKNGGTNIQDELLTMTDPALRATTSGNLPCRVVIHVVMPADLDEIGNTVFSVLEAAESQRCKSISIPAIGTGKLKLSSVEVAKIMQSTFKEFSHAYPKTHHLTKVDIIVFEQSMVADFKAGLISYHKPKEPEKPPEQASFTTQQGVGSQQSAAPNSGAAGTSAAASTDTLAFGSAKVSVIQGDITTQTSDAIVNSTGSQFNLSQGMVARHILSKGGQQIQDELSSASGQFLRVTSGGNMPCKKIFHVVVPDQVAKIKDCVANILQEAEKQGCTSLSLPAVGTGNLRLPAAAVASILKKAFEEFFSNKSPVTLKVVDVVIHNQSLIQDFRHGLLGPQQAQSHSSGSASSANVAASGISPSANVFGAINVTVRQGDITSENSDAIVNSTGSSFDLSSGQVACKILQKGGSQIQTELNSASGKFLRVTGGGNLPCKKIFHVVIPDRVDRIKDSVLNILQEAERQQCASLSIPAIGTGNLRLSAASVADIMKQAFTEFSSQNPQTRSLKTVDIVIFNMSLIQEFRTGLTATSTSNTGSSGAAGSIAGGASTGSAPLSTSIGPLTLSITKGDITEEANDVIVISMGDKFDLSVGMVGKAVLKKGGKQIQDAVSAASGNSLRITDAGNLKCKKIFHVALNDAQEIKNCVVNLLKEAENQNFVSLSIPAIGSGKLQLPDATAAKHMRKGLEEFVKQVPQTKSLRIVDVVIYDQSRVAGFQTELISASGGAVSKQKYVWPSVSSVKTAFHDKKQQAQTQAQTFWSNITGSGAQHIGHLKVFVRQGNIVNEKADAIVNSTRTTFNLSHGAISSAILAKGGNQLQHEVSRAQGSRIRVTSGGNLHCKILHVAFPGDENEMQQCLVDVFDKAESESFKSISIPAVGTGNKKMSHLSLPNQMLEALYEFVDSPSLKRVLKTVNIVIFDKEMVAHFERIFQNPSARGAYRQKSVGAVMDRVTLHLYTQNQKSIKEARKDIEKGVEEAFYERKVDDELICSLKKTEQADVESAGIRHGVKVTLRRAKKTLVISGLREKVWDANEEIQRILRGIHAAKAVKDLASYSWQYFESGKSWKNFDASAHKKLEELYKGFKDGHATGGIQEQLMFEGQTSTFTIDFTENTITGYNQFHIKRVNIDDFPREWDPMTGEPFLLVELKTDSNEYLKVKKKMNLTLPTCQIKSITRVQNRKLYTQYQNLKREIVCSNTEIERKLFHGTSAESANEIINCGFDRSYSGVNIGGECLYGNGSYFARDASYSDRPGYAKPEKGTGIKTMLLADVLTGDYCKGAPGMKAAPSKPNSRQKYDSLVDKESNPSIFVVFPDAGVYPAYVIKYK